MRPYPAAYVSLSLRILTLNRPPPPLLWINISVVEMAEWWSKISLIITPGWLLPFHLALLITWLQHSHVRKVLLTYGKQTHVTPKPRVAEEADYSQFRVALNFPFLFQYTHMLFFYTDAIKTNWKSTPWNRKSSCVFSEKDRQVIRATPARLWSRARQRLVKTDHISFLPAKQSRLHRKTTKLNDHTEKTEISVAAKTSEKKTLKRNK